MARCFRQAYRSLVLQRRVVDPLRTNGWSRLLRTVGLPGLMVALILRVGVAGTRFGPRPQVPLVIAAQAMHRRTSGGRCVSGLPA
jgi:hypothetical protein